MLKKIITYTDYDNVIRKEAFYFNLSKAELTKMQLEIPGGLKNLIERIVQENDTPKIVEFFNEILKRSYGIKSDDGKRFMKSEEIWKSFSETEAYSELFMELLNEPETMANFITAIMPADLVQEAEKEAAKNGYDNIVDAGIARMELEEAK